MDPKYLEELKKLKEQKDQDLSRIQRLADLSIPDLEEEKSITQAEIPSEEPETMSGETIKFDPVPQTETETAPSPAEGKRGRKPGKETAEERAKRTKATKIALISIAGVVAVLSVLLAIFFGARKANRSKFTYDYWGMGIAIENGVYDYTFFGNLKNITLYDEIGQVKALAEFEKGNCIRETFFTAEGDVAYSYTHEYNEQQRTLSAYYKDGQLVQSVKYTRIDDSKIRAEKTYHLEENRTEISVLTLKNGGLFIQEFYDGEVLLSKQSYEGTLVSESTEYLSDGGIKEKIVYEYNSSKKLSTQTSYDADNNILSRMVNQYNEKSLLTKTLYYDGKGSIQNYTTYNYDLSNNPIKEVNYTGDGTMQQQTLRVYNDKNKVKKETCLRSDGTIIYCNGYDYDEKGYIKKSIEYNVDNSTVIDKYTLYQRSEGGSIEQTETYNAGNILIEKSIYNKHGFLSKWYQFNGAGIMIKEEKMDYNKNKSLTQKEASQFSDTGDKIFFTKEQFNESGLVTLRISEGPAPESYEHYIFQYDNSGLKSNETLFDRNGKTIYDRQYNSKSEIMSESLYENGEKVFYNEYTYNQKGLVETNKSLDIAQSRITVISYTYNKNDFVIQTLEAEESGALICKKEYDANGNVETQYNYDYNGEVSTKEKYQYDSKNNVIAKEVFDKRGYLTSKFIYYYKTDGTSYYTEFNSDGIVVNDSRGPQYIPGIDLEEDNESTETSTDNSNMSTSSKPSSGETSGNNTDDTTDTGNSLDQEDSSSNS